MYSDLLESMPYLSAVSNESLRLWPTVVRLEKTFSIPKKTILKLTLGEILS